MEKSLDAFLDYLVGKGVMVAAELETFKTLMNTRHMFGIIALRESYITPDQLQDILENRCNGCGQVKIGEILLEQNMMTNEQVSEVLEIQKNAGALAPDIILDTGILPRDILEEELEKFLES